MTRPGRKTFALLAVAASAAALWAFWDWNWFRDPVVDYLNDRSQRNLRIGDLHVSFSSGLDPTVRLRDVHVDNAPWARASAGQPFATAGEVSFTFAWRSLIERRPVVSKLLLVDAAIALERQADGHRNWRLRNPDDTGPGKFKFLRLEAHRSTLRFVHDGLALDLNTAASDLPAPVPVEHGAPLTTRIDFRGKLHGASFAGSASTSTVLTFLETGEAFSLRGSATAGNTRLDADGQVTDLFKLDAVDADVQLAGPSLAALHPLLPQAWPETAAYSARARLSKAQAQWDVTALRADIGRSDVAGEVHYNGHGDRPFVDATLTSKVLHSADVMRPKSAKTPEAAPTAPTAASAASAPDGQGLGAADADVTWQVQSLHVPVLPVLSAVRLKAHLDSGLLDLSPVQAQLAGGQAQGRVTVDGRQQPAAVKAELSWRNLRLEQLLPPLPDKGEATGPVSGSLKLTSRGNTVPALLSNLNGDAQALLKGGRLSAALDAKLALNGGKLLRAAVTDANDVPIQCARVDVVMRDGRGDVFPLLLDTTQTRVDGRGEVDLREDPRFDLLLTPSPKQTALLALRQSIRVRGTAGDIKLSLVPPEAIDATASCDSTPPVKSR